SIRCGRAYPSCTSAPKTDMKILFVNNSLEAARGGGTAERTYALARAFARLGDQVSVLTTDMGHGHSRLENVNGVRLFKLRSILDRFHLFVPRFDQIYRAV